MVIVLPRLKDANFESTCIFHRRLQDHHDTLMFIDFGKSAWVNGPRKELGGIPSEDPLQLSLLFGGMI